MKRVSDTSIQIEVLCKDLTSEKISLKSDLLVTIDFYQSRGSICGEFSRTKGDYLSFVDLYMLVSDYLGLSSA